MEAISQDQSVFLPFRFILNNILLIHETIAWVEKSKQLLVFFKLDFSKAYHKVDWSFLFDYMDKLEMTKMFFQGASANVAVNGKASKVLVIEKGVRQGCPLAPYLFLIVGEALNAKIYEEQRLGKIEGICLPMSNRRQIIVQYADDINFTLKASREGMIRLP
jgi:hypothetical protein